MNTKTNYALVFNLAATFILVLPGCGNDASKSSKRALKEAPNAINHYTNLGITSQNYLDVATEGQIQEGLPWSGHYWPNQHWGIANRWQTNFPEGNPFVYRPPNLDMLRHGSPAQRNRLSPAEKFDLFRGQAEFPLTLKEINKAKSLWQSYNSQIPDWFGYCDGWAIAAITIPEPQTPFTVQTPFDFDIEFYPSDIKALLSYFFSTTDVTYRIVGGRCNQEKVEMDPDGRPKRRECRDLNPASFHLALDHFIGYMQQPLIMDLDHASKVWNYPVIGYRFEYQNFRNINEASSYPYSAPGTQHLVDVNLELTYVALALPATDRLDRQTRSKQLSYTLELNANKVIIGGEWRSAQHPDFMWDMRGFSTENPSVPHLNYAAMQQLLQKSGVML
jgi:hypothetical protein